MKLTFKGVERSCLPLKLPCITFNVEIKNMTEFLLWYLDGEFELPAAGRAPSFIMV